jgi:predicted kinase
MAIFLVALKGMPGSGKSTVGRALSRRRGWPLIDKDDIKDLIDGHADDSGSLAYATMFRIARSQLLHGLSVICDSPLTDADLYARAWQIAAETGALLAIIECQCRDERILRQRIEARQALDLPAHHTTDWERFRAYRSGVMTKTYPITDCHLIIDTTRPLEPCLNHVDAWLDSLASQHSPRCDAPS